MPELKPCPFCGDALELLVIARDWYRVAHPENDLCPLGGHDYTYAQTAQGLKTLQEDWNRRAIPADQVLVPRELLEQIEISLRSEIEERYAATKDHPAIRQKYLRDIAEADELRALLQH